MKFAYFASAIALVAGLLVGCGASNPLQVKTDVVTTEFDLFSSYAWYAKDLESQGNVPQARQFDALLKSKVNDHLAGKGYQSVASGNDFYINYEVTADDSINVKEMNVYSGLGEGFVWRHGERTVANDMYLQGKEYEVEQFKKGTLVLDIINAKTNKLAWRGIANKRIESSLNNVEREKVVSEAVSRLLKDIPKAAR